MEIGLLVSSTFFAVGSAYCGFRHAEVSRQHKARKKKLVQATHLQSSDCPESEGLARKVIERVKVRSLHERNRNRAMPHILRSPRRKQRLQKLVKQSGLSDDITDAGVALAQQEFTILGVSIGLLVGIMFSTELALLLGVIGAIGGFRCVVWSFKQEMKERTNSLERGLSEMIEIVVLGLRSGLSFDRSLTLYCEHFPTGLGASMLHAQQRWSMGFVSREQGLREVAESYDSSLFSRMIENLIRSLRFGTSLSENLEACAVESREIYKANMQEKVAKAPVKMMIPTGTLILPAMLLMVLGPVLLDLMKGL